MNTIPSRYDSQCCGAVGSSPSHRPGCKFEIAADIAKSRRVTLLRASLSLMNQSPVFDFEQACSRINTLTEMVLGLFDTIDQAAIGIAP